MPAQPQHSLRVFETLEGHERLAPGLSPAIRSYFFGRLCLATGDLAGYAAFLEAADRSEFESASNRVVELGHATAALGDRARARPYLQSVVDETRAPDGVPLTDGAVALALLGRPDEAVRAADEAIRLVPESRDAVNGPTVAVQRAWVLIRAGGERADEGSAELQRLLGAFREQPRAFATYSLGVMLRDDARAHRIVQEAIEWQDRAFAASGGFTSPAPVADPRP